MKRLIFNIALPLTLLSFALFTKWQYVFVEDIGYEYMYGFPLIYTCRGWASSMSTQYFLFELIIDLIVYFILWVLLALTLQKILLRVKIPRWLVVTIYSFIIVPVLILGNLFFRED